MSKKSLIQDLIPNIWTAYREKEIKTIRLPYFSSTTKEGRAAIKRAYNLGNSNRMRYQLETILGGDELKGEITSVPTQALLAKELSVHARKINRQSVNQQLISKLFLSTKGAPVRMKNKAKTLILRQLPKAKDNDRVAKINKDSLFGDLNNN